MTDTLTKTLAGIGVFAVLVALGTLFAFPLMWLVNGIFTKDVIHALFGQPELTWGKAWALQVLCVMLFKGTGSSTK